MSHLMINDFTQKTAYQKANYYNWRLVNIYDKEWVLGNEFVDFGGRSRCLSKIHDEGHPKPFQLVS